MTSACLRVSPPVLPVDPPGEVEAQGRGHLLRLADGTRLKVLEFAQAKKPALGTLVLVPGFASVFNSWAEAVRLLAGAFRIFYFETREKASSLIPGPHVGRTVTLRRMALDLSEVVEQLQLDSTPYSILASSTGTTVIFEALSHEWIHPAGAILVGPMVQHRIQPIAALLTSCLPSSLKQMAMPFYRLYLHLTYVNRKCQPYQYAKYVRSAEEVCLPKIRRLLWEMTTYDGTHLLSRIRTPCLLVAAQADNMHRSAETRRIHQLLRGSSYVDLGTNEAAHRQPLVETVMTFVRQIRNALPGKPVPQLP